MVPWKLVHVLAGKLCMVEYSGQGTLENDESSRFWAMEPWKMVHVLSFGAWNLGPHVCILTAFK